MVQRESDYIHVLTGYVWISTAIPQIFSKVDVVTQIINGYIAVKKCYLSFTLPTTIYLAKSEIQNFLAQTLTVSVSKIYCVHCTCFGEISF